MSTVAYTKSLSEDLSGSLNTGQLQKEINDASSGISVDCIAVLNVNGDNVEILFASTLGGGEETALTTIISNHVPESTMDNVSSFTYAPRTNSSNAPSYERLGGPFKYNGSDAVGVIEKIEVISYKDASPTSYSVRIYDKMHLLVLAEKTGLTNTSEAIVDLGAVANVPGDMGLLGVEVKQVGGTGNDQNVYVEQVIVYHSD